MQTTRVFLLIVLFMVITSPAFAQEQRGSIEGIVRDSSGAILPGTMVEARSPRMIGVATAAADASGAYRFPALPPGTYEVTGRLQGFAPVSVADIEVSLGQIKRVDLILTIGGISEKVQVTAVPPTIDVRQSATSMNLTRETIELIPRGRDFTSVLTIAPGTSNEFKLAGVSIDGASGAENRYVIDGIETTDVLYGVSGQDLVTDFVDEIQVKSSGYKAEFGASTGGVVNVVSRSGTNVWQRDLGAYFGSDNLNGPPRKFLQISPYDNSRAEYVLFNDDDFTRWEPLLTVGGPIARNRVWSFAGYVPALVSTSRTVTFTGTSQPTLFHQREKRDQIIASLSMRVSDQLNWRMASNVDNRRRDGSLPWKAGTGDPSVDYAGLGTRKPNFAFSGNLDYTPSDGLHVDIRAGHFRYDYHDIGVPAETQYFFYQSNIGMAGIPDALQRSRYYSNLSTNYGTDHDLQTRTGLSVGGTYYASLAGRHAIKAGVQLDRYSNDVLSGRLGPFVGLNWGLTYSTLDDQSVKGAFGYYVWSQFQAVGEVHSTNLGIYAQDAWTIEDKLTLSLGVRTERENVPSFQAAYPGIRFGFGDKLAPRAGFAYDIDGTGRWKAYGSYGVFYDVMKLNVSRGLFGAFRWIQSAYTLDTPDWTTIKPPTNLPGRFIEDVNFVPVSNDPTHPENGVVDPNLGPMKTRELTFGLDRELGAATSLGVRYVRKRLLRAIEDQGVLVPGVGEVYAIANVGFGPVARTSAGVDVSSALGHDLPDPRQPKAVRDYDALEVRLRRRLASGFAINASYSWSRLWGNYSGLASSDEDGRLSPNGNRFFDLVIMSFDQNASAVYGPLQTDRPHQLKAQPIYTLPWGTTIAANQFIASGTPISHRVDMRAFGTGIYYQGRGSAGRTSVFSQTDFYVQHEFRLARRGRLQVQLNVLNLFDQAKTIDRYQFVTQQPITISEAAFFAGFDAEALIAAQNRRRDPRFLMDSAFQAPRELRLGIKYLF